MAAGSIIVVSCAGCGSAIETRSRCRKWCDDCLVLRNRANVSQWQRANREHVNAYWRDRSAQENLHAARYAKEKEKRKEQARAYYADNREKVLARMSSEEGRRYSRERMRENMRDPGFRLHSHVSRAIRLSIKDKHRRKWETLVGYSVEDLQRHVERQFKRGMSWKNYGKWHIDHIVPKSSFTFETADDPDFLACWALTNLRPMWAAQNISKHGKRLHLL